MSRERLNGSVSGQIFSTGRKFVLLLSASKIIISLLLQFLLHFTIYFPNVSYVNSKRPRMEDCSNEGKKKQGRRQEEKEGATRDGEDEIRERTSNGRERRRNRGISCEFLV